MPLVAWSPIFRGTLRGSHTSTLALVGKASLRSLRGALKDESFAAHNCCASTFSIAIRRLQGRDRISVEIRIFEFPLTLDCFLGLGFADPNLSMSTQDTLSRRRFYSVVKEQPESHRLAAKGENPNCILGFRQESHAVLLALGWWSVRGSNP